MTTMSILTLTIAEMSVEAVLRTSLRRPRRDADDWQAIHAFCSALREIRQAIADEQEFAKNNEPNSKP